MKRNTFRAYNFLRIVVYEKIMRKALRIKNYKMKIE